MDTRLVLLLEQLEQRLRSQGAGILQLLAMPGRESAEVEAVLDAFAGVAPDELATWFSWQDGLAEIDHNHPHRMTLIGQWMPYSLDEALAYVREGQYWAGQPRDGKPWLPLFEGPIGAGQGRSLLIASWLDARQVRIVRAWWGEPELLEGPASLADLVSGWLRAFEAGMRWDSSIDNWSAEDVPPSVVAGWSRARIF